jgi:hypothetical protein
MIRVASTAASSFCEPLRQLLTAHGIDNHVFNAASLSIDRQARQVKTGRTDINGLIRALTALVRGERHVCRLVARALDVARFGTDRTVFTLRSGSRVEYVEVQAKKDTMEVAARAKVLSERLNATAVYVDVIGVGAGVVDKLKLDGVEVVAVNAAEVAPNRSANKDDAQGRIMRDYLWIEMARWLREDEPAFLIDKDMAEDLAGELASVKYGIDGKGFLVVEMKDQMRKRLGRSPDLADSLALTFAPKLGFGILDYYRQLYEDREQAKADRADLVMDAALEAALIEQD